MLGHAQPYMQCTNDMINLLSANPDAAVPRPYQQWMAAPAWIASTEPVANGRRPMSPRTATMGVLQQK
jgi:hypothetical protein